MSEMHPEQLVNGDDSTDEVEPSEDEQIEPTPTDADTEPDLVAYKVIGRHRVDEVKRGGLLRLDPNEPRTKRLIDRGSIAPTQED